MNQNKTTTPRRGRLLGKLMMAALAGALVGGTAACSKSDGSSQGKQKPSASQKNSCSGKDGCAAKDKKAASDKPAKNSCSGKNGCA